ALVPPLAPDDLGFRRDGSELLLQLDKCVAIRESGTGWPSLTFSGSRNSNLRSVVLIPGRSFDLKRNPLQGQRSKGFRGDDHLACGKTLERETPGQKTQGFVLRRRVYKANADHRAPSTAIPSSPQAETAPERACLLLTVPGARLARRRRKGRQSR